MASALAEELVEEILSRIPPDEPAHLVSAALVCKSWQRILSDHGFRRRYCKFHGTPPLLGYIENDADGHADFFPTTSTTSPVSTAAPRTVDNSYWRMALDCHHGRVLIYNVWDDLITEELIVWDPITGDQQHLGVPVPKPHDSVCTGSVLCATNGCDHLDCGGGPFAVVFVWTSPMENAVQDTTICACIYSSEARVWSAPTSINVQGEVPRRPGVFIRDALYFSITVNQGLGILKYDLVNHGLSVIDTPPRLTWTTLVIKGDHRGLQIVTLSDNNCIYLWSLKDTNGICGWVKHEAMELPAQLLERESYRHEVLGFVGGRDIIFIGTCDGMFTLNLKTRQVTKVYEGETAKVCSVLPYMSFYTPR